MPEYTISKDGIYLREQARQNMQAHLQDRFTGRIRILYGRHQTSSEDVLGVATKGQGSDSSSSNSNSNSDSDRTLSSTVNDRTRLRALALANDWYKYKMGLVTNGVVTEQLVLQWIEFSIFNTFEA